jgi:hypothetical protein
MAPTMIMMMMLSIPTTMASPGKWSSACWARPEG